MKPARYLIYSLLLLSVACCMPQTMYHSYHHIANERWGRGDTLSFHLAVDDTLPAMYGLFLIVRNSTGYPYQNLPLSVTYNMPDTAVWRTDTLHFNVADSTGRWLGSGWGSLYQLSVLLKEAPVGHPARFTFKVVHLLGDEQLVGVSDVGIQLSKVSSNAPHQYAERRKAGL